VDAAELLADLLAQSGHTAEIAHTAEQALTAVAAFHPHLAVLDIGLPGIDGFELAVRIRSEAPAIRLISLSGYGDERTRQRSEASGFEAHFTKPIPVRELLELMHP
jgi:DNA-binding response OmpR family regulator